MQTSLLILTYRLYFAYLAATKRVRFLKAIIIIVTYICGQVMCSCCVPIYIPFVKCNKTNFYRKLPTSYVFKNISILKATLFHKLMFDLVIIWNQLIFNIPFMAMYFFHSLALNSLKRNNNLKIKLKLQ